MVTCAQAQGALNTLAGKDIPNEEEMLVDNSRRNACLVKVNEQSDCIQERVTHSFIRVTVLWIILSSWIASWTLHQHAVCSPRVFVMKSSCCLALMGSHLLSKTPSISPGNNASISLTSSKCVVLDTTLLSNLCAPMVPCSVVATQRQWYTNASVLALTSFSSPKRSWKSAHPRGQWTSLRTLLHVLILPKISIRSRPSLRTQSRTRPKSMVLPPQETIVPTNVCDSSPTTSTGAQSCVHTNDQNNGSTFVCALQRKSCSEGDVGPSV